MATGLHGVGDLEVYELLNPHVGGGHAITVDEKPGPPGSGGPGLVLRCLDCETVILETEYPYMSWLVIVTVDKMYEHHEFDNEISYTEALRLADSIAQEWIIMNEEGMVEVELIQIEGEYPEWRNQVPERFREIFDKKNREIDKAIARLEKLVETLRDRKQL